ncbi:hypothetical protein BD408DRAFT_439118 [Parasitella parasitica]|nr:hypothetical protein BD408DRAFT_439118 [Parasitella parasitica]
MGGEGAYTDQQTYSSTPPKGYNSNANTPLQKNQHPHSSPVQQEYPKTSSRISRRYATPEESDAVVPIFNTPTNMYLKKDLNPQQRYASTPPQPPPPVQQQQHQQPSTPKHYSKTHHSRSSFDPLSTTSSFATFAKRPERQEPSLTRPNTNNFMKNGQDHRNNYSNTSHGTASFSSTTSASSKQDMLLAQLIEMGFSLEASKVALTASGSKNLQDALDILVQNEQAEKNAETQKRDSSSSEDDDPQSLKQSEEKWKREQEERRREYLEQLKRNKPTPPKPGVSSSSSQNGPNGPNGPNGATSATSSPTSPKTSPMPPQHAPMPSPKANAHTSAPTQPDSVTSYADKERKQGNYHFNKGQFADSESVYTLAINALPVGHGDIVLLCNNRAAARLKQGKYQDCLTDCSTAIDIARKNMQNNTPISPIMSATSTNMKAQLIKALHRKACALEGLRLFEAAIQVYEEYVRLDDSRSAQVAQGIMRCQQALLDSKKKQQQWKPATSASDTTSAFPDIDFNIFIPKVVDDRTQAQLDEINSSKAVKEMRDREKRREAEDAEKLENEDRVNAQISVWKTGKDKNLRALLGSLELILWPGVQWKGVMMSELLDVRKCKLTYMKAISKVHPDKLPADATVEQRMLASGIFTTLNQAWDIFKTENNL